MDVTDIPTKTPRGVDEILTRANRLAQRMRNVLILVDGNTSVGAMVARFPTMGDIGQLLQELADAGYVEFKTVSAPVLPDISPAGDPSSGPKALDAAVRELSRSLYDLIGPSADVFTAKLEVARNRAAFLQATQSSVAIVSSFAGKAKAETFRQSAQNIADRFFAE